jgi:hypothetical protein
MRRSAVTGILLYAASTLAACTSTEQALDPSAITAPQQTSSPTTANSTTASIAATQGAATTATTVPANPASGQVAAITSNARVQIAPIVGATVEAAGPLSERIAAKARERGIRLAGGNGTATLLLKGYFSAITEGKETTVIYVWDVLDPAGNRLHRIQGQQKTPAKGEGWASVSAPTMQDIADQTIDQLAAWLSARPG